MHGEIVALIGANGAGKSTLMMTVCGNPRARDGQILFDGRDITRLPTHEIARLKLAQAPEGRRIFPRMTVLENLQMGATVAAPAEFDRDLDRALTLFPRLKERLTQRGGTLSGGEQQMLAIARALMARPRLLLLDEPSLGLAPLIVRQIFDAIKTLNAEDGLTVFLVEQNAFHALKLAHRGYVMVNGLITLSGTGRELLERPEVKSAYLEGGRQRNSMSPILALFYEEGSFGIFVLVSIVLGGGAAALAGRAIALTWRPWWQVARLYADPRRRGPLHPFRLVRWHAVVGALLYRRRVDLHGVRICRFRGRAGRADGQPISLDQRAGRAVSLAPQAAMT